MRTRSTSTNPRGRRAKSKGQRAFALCPLPLPLRHHINFALERVPKLVSSFRHVTIEKQVAILPYGSAGVGYAYTILSAFVTVLWNRVHCRDYVPATCCRVDASFGSAIESGIGSVARVELVQLRAARVG